MKYYILFNPYAGYGDSENKANELKNKFDNASVISVTEIGSYSEFLAPLTEEDAVILCGGDGTLNRFANDTYDLDYKCDILFAAAGTGNDFLTDFVERWTRLRLGNVRVIHSGFL